MLCLSAPPTRQPFPQPCTNSRARQGAAQPGRQARQAMLDTCARGTLLPAARPLVLSRRLRVAAGCREERQSLPATHALQRHPRVCQASSGARTAHNGPRRARAAPTPPTLRSCSSQPLPRPPPPIRPSPCPALSLPAPSTDSTVIVPCVLCAVPSGAGAGARSRR